MAFEYRSQPIIDVDSVANITFRGGDVGRIRQFGTIESINNGGNLSFVEISLQF